MAIGTVSIGAYLREQSAVVEALLDQYLPPASAPPQRKIGPYRGTGKVIYCAEIAAVRLQRSSNVKHAT